MMARGMSGPLAPTIAADAEEVLTSTIAPAMALLDALGLDQADPAAAKRLARARMLRTVIASRLPVSKLDDLKTLVSEWVHGTLEATFPLESALVDANCADAAGVRRLLELLDAALPEVDAHLLVQHALSALHTPLSPLLPWDLSRELAAYVLKHPSVSVPLRLAASEEELLLDHACSLPTGASAPNVLNARREMLTAAAAAAANGTDFHVTPLAPSAPVSSPFDAVSDRSCIESEGMGALLAKFTTLSYSRPENMVGIPALQALDRWIGHGLELRGGKDEKGFLFLYELMRGDVLFKLRNDDSSLLLGFMLIRTLPPSDTQNKDVLMSILRVLANNGPSLTRLLPKFEDDRRVKICAPQHI